MSETENIEFLVEWSHDRQGYFYWDESDNPVGCFQSKEEAITYCEVYYWTMSKDDEA
jgi:hypothetical protein